MENEEPRLCSECRHLVGRRSYPEMAAEWKCHAKENVTSAGVDLVTGATLYHLRFLSCYAARSPAAEEEGCGTAGKWWERYSPPDFHVARSGQQKTADELLKELDE